MATYSVTLCDKANISLMESPDSLDKAQAYVDAELSGKELVEDGVDPYGDSAWICWYEITKLDEEGEPTDEVHTSKCFYQR